MLLALFAWARPAEDIPDWRLPPPADAPDPLYTPHRPPQQTAVQATAMSALLAEARNLSEAAKPALLAAIEQTRPTLLFPYNATSAEDLLQMLYWEFSRLPVMHNAPLTADEKGHGDDTALLTTMRNGYLQNVCQRYVLGAEGNGLHNSIMVPWFKLPPWAKPDEPTLRETNDCFLYDSDAIDKRDAGYYLFGAVTYILNPRWARHAPAAGDVPRLVIVPADSGAYISQPGQAVYGTLEHFYHLVLPHMAAIGDNLAYIMERWWVPGTPTKSFNSIPYFELEWFGNVWLPEDVLYILVKFSPVDGAPGVWGTPIGKTLEDFMRTHRRPLLWASHPILIRHGPSPLLCCCCCGVFACCLLTPHPTHLQADGDDSGAIIDPVVNRVANSKITAQDAATFAQRYDDTHTWTFSQLYGVSPPYMRVKFRSCTHGLPCTDACTPLEANASNQIVGIGGDGSCVYWVDVPSASLPWECLNDGTCAQSTRGNYSSEAECVASCGGGHFACVAGPHPTCQPDPNGQCYTLEQCEAGCGSTVVCPEPPPPPSPPPSPPPPPPPPPPHYSDPVLTGCLPDELELSLTGVPGSGTFCSPACKGASPGTCPADVPAGVAAKPACLIRDPVGAGMHCALHCTPGDAECGPRGECSTAFGKDLGVCVWEPAPARCKEEDDPDDCAALVALERATEHGVRHHAGWRMDGTVSLCDWRGVCCGDDPTGADPYYACSGTGFAGKVKLLRLPMQQLSGTVPS